MKKILFTLLAAVLFFGSTAAMAQAATPNVYPERFTKDITIENLTTAYGEIKIYNFHGDVVASYSGLIAGSFTFNLSHLNEGSYIVWVQQLSIDYTAIVTKLGRKRRYLDGYSKE